MMRELRSDAAARTLCALLVLVAALNALLFTWKAANPLISSDAWYFVDSFLEKALDGNISIADLFAKRDTLDHSQPLNKLFLVANARYLGLDYRLEALVGWAGIVLGAACLSLVAARTWRGFPRTTPYWLSLAAISAVYFSLNSSMLFTWPLVTFAQVVGALILLCFVMGRMAFESSRPWLLAAIATTISILGDSSGMLASIALALTCCWASWRRGRATDAIPAIVAISIGLAAYKALLGHILHDVPPGPASAKAGELVAKLASGNPADFLVPFHAGLIQNGQLMNFFPSHWESVRVVLGVAMLLAHAWFWREATRRRVDACSFMAVAMMLLFYGYVAGILIGRIGHYGVGYFNEPRYPLVYQVGVLALPMMALSDPARVLARRNRYMPGALALALLCAVQIPLSVSSWKEVRYLRNYYQTMAAQMLSLARHPETSPPQCVANLVICDWDARRKSLLVSRLVRYRLNLYSPEFRRRHALAQ